MSKIIKQDIINLKNRLNQLYINLHQRNLYNDDISGDKISIDSINKLIFYKNKIEEDGDFRPRQIKQKYGVSKGEIIKKEVLDNIAYDLTQLEASKKQYKLIKTTNFSCRYSDTSIDENYYYIEDILTERGDGYNYIGNLIEQGRMPEGGEIYFTKDKKRKLLFRGLEYKHYRHMLYGTVDIYAYE